ncbi:hypothetical protein Ndes2437B_g03939 [Nannochloris sp. 'desiccata']
MTDYHTTYKGQEGETTEWDDIQAKHGNKPAKDPVWKPDTYAPEEEEPKKDESYLDTKDADELEELEDDFADDRFLEDYRRKRIEELKKGTTRPRFGTLETIRASEFVAQCVHTFVGLAAVGGKATSPDRVAMALNCYGPVCGDSEQDAQEQVRNMVESLLVERAAAEAAKGQGGRAGGGGGEDDDEDSDFY